MAASLSDPSLRGAAHALEIAVDAEPGRVIVAVAGEWDLAARPRVAEAQRAELKIIPGPPVVARPVAICRDPGPHPRGRVGA